jgi:hypothetical protein
MTPREKIHVAIGDIAEPHGYTVEDILGKSRTKRLVAVRRLCVLMFREHGYSTTEIGRLMGRDHSTIVHALNKPVDTCNQLLVRPLDQQQEDDKMINWTKDERVAALLPQIIAHYRTDDEFSLEHEAKLELIREEYMWERSNDYRGECADDFEEWHGQPTVEEFVEALLDAEPTS